MSVGDYEGLHSFVFLRDAPPEVKVADVMSSLRDIGKPRVYFASEVLAGPHLAFAHIAVEEDALADLEGFIRDEFWVRGLHPEVEIEVGTYVDPLQMPQGVKRSCQEIIALTRIRTVPGQAKAVIQDIGLGAGPAFRGASRIIGTHDAIVQLGGERLSEVTDPLRDFLPSVNGVQTMETTLIDGRP